MAKKLTSEKAKEILRDKSVHGNPLTEKQRKFFGAIAGGAKPYEQAQIGTMLTALPSNMMDRLSDALAFPQRAITKLFTGEYQTPSEAMKIQNPVGAAATDILLDPVNLLGAGLAGKAAKASTKTGILSKAYLKNPLARKELRDPNKSFRVAGMDAYDDFVESGVVRSHTPMSTPGMSFTEKMKQRPTAFPSFQKGYADMRYLPEEGGVVFETSLPTFKRGDINPVTGNRVKGRHYAHRVIDTETGKVLSSVPGKDIKVYKGKPHWLMGYQEIKPPKQKQDGGWLDKYEEGGVLKQKTKDNYGTKPNANNSDVSLPPGFVGLAYNTKGRNYSPAWGGQFAMGGALPGATGMMYARTINPAPSNGPYAKKTKASAQNGQEMKFYQAGLDFTPKTISQNGTVVDPMGYWNPENIGNPVIIPSTDITMQGVYEPLIGISDTGDVQYMEPGEDYQFDGNYVTEYPMAKGGISVNEADAQPIKKLNQLLNFTNYNTMAKNGKGLKKAQRGDTIGTGGLPRIQIPTMEKLKGGMPSKTIKPSATPSATTPTTGMSGAMPYLQAASDVFGGLQMLGQQRNALQEAIQQQKLTNVFAKAVASRPQQYFQNQYVRPEDVIFQPEQMSPSYGVGTNILAQDGTVIRNNIGGTPTEIMNVYNPGTMYTDLGYEPLNDTNKMKAFKKGGKIKQAKLGDQNWMQGTSFGNAMMNQGGGDILQSITGAITGEPDAGSKIGKGIGTAAGTLLGGPVGGMIGGALGEIAGDIIDPTEDKIRQANRLTQRNQGDILAQSAGLAIQEQFGLRNGGETSPYKWVSHTWQPQVITTFGEHKLKDLLKPPTDADMLRAGGHLKEFTPASAAAMQTDNFDMGGDLEVHSGGYLAPMSQNPYLPDGGITYQTYGNSHDEADENGKTGVHITYGKNPVEIERREPVVKLKDGTSGESNLTVFGNIKITNAFADMLADPKAKGKKFKTYVADLSKQENKQNKLIDKSIDQLDSLDVQSSFDKLALGTLQANIEGANAKLKNLADKKINAASLQNAINDTKEEELVNITNEGNVLAEKGASIPKAQSGRSISPADYNYLTKLYNEAKAQGRGDKVALFQKEFSRIAPDIATQVLSEYDVTAYGKAKGFPKTDVRSNIDEIFGPRTERYKALLDRSVGGVPELPRTKLPDLKYKLPTPSPTPTEATKAQVTPPAQSKLNILPFLNQALQYLRPSDVEPLDPNQLIGEMYALSQNQVEPVYAQKYIPELSTPVDISLQDILNENQAAFNATQRLVGYNPAAIGTLNAQKYAANQRVLGEQFRLNQAEKQRVYSENRNLLNQAKLQNLQILERQADKQATALSKTKATTQAALNSIASKYAQNKLDNRTLAVYENMYNYRYDPNFRLQNMQMAQFNIPTVGSTTQTKTAKGGKSVKKLNLNSSVVKALKNI